MFDCVVNKPLILVVNKVWVPISLIRMKNQPKIKALLNGTDVVNMELWTKMWSAATKPKPWNNLNYWV